jgi:hypothetical protein
MRLKWAADARASAVDHCGGVEGECVNRNEGAKPRREGVMMMAEHEEMRAMAEGSPGEAMTPSGPRGDNPATAGTGMRQLCSKTPENADGEINPSAPGETGITPRSDR